MASTAAGSSRLDCLQPLLRCQFEDLCTSVHEQCVGMLANVLDGCVRISELIRQEADSKSQTYAKLYFSNILNDLHFVCVREIDSLSKYFIDAVQIPKHTLSKDQAESTRAVHSIIWKPETKDTKNESGATRTMSKDVKRHEVVRDRSLSNGAREASKKNQERYVVFLEERAGSPANGKPKSSQSEPQGFNHELLKPFSSTPNATTSNFNNKLQERIDSKNRQPMSVCAGAEQATRFDLFKKPKSVSKQG